MDTDSLTVWILAAIGGYLLGSIPFGLLLTRAAGLGDIRNIGSGNIGATNVLRTGRRDIAGATLLLDGGKAAAALLLAGWVAGTLENLEPPFDQRAAFIAGAAAFIGHCFPVWLRFKGGKGVATFFGALFAGLWPVGLIAGVAWLATAAISRYSSLAALVAAAVAPVAAWLLNKGGAWGVGFCALLAVLIYTRHRPNIERLVKGEESKIGVEKATGQSHESS